MKRKVCFKCKQHKPYSQFYKHPDMADGHMGKCKECAKEDVTLNRRLKIEHYREYDRNRGNRQEYVKKKNGSAYAKVYRAVKKCLLVKKPCQMCGSIKRVHAHHDDYSKPLEVMWLCPVHHKARHAYLEHCVSL